VKRDLAEIVKEALTLPLKERAALVESLVASLAPHADADGSEVLSDSNVGILYDQARDRALARLRDGLDLRWTPALYRDDLHRYKRPSVRAYVSGGVFLL
jgi:hypothetical protein